MTRDLFARDYVHVWVDGIHTGVRLGPDDRLCSLVMVGARLDGRQDWSLSPMATGSHRRVRRSY